MYSFFAVDLVLVLLFLFLFAEHLLLARNG